MEKKKIIHNKLKQPNQSIDSCGTNNELADNLDEIEIIMIIRLKQQLASQLCSLIDCAFHCLKSGQTFQYTSLLIINKIIDAFVRYETFASPLDFDYIYEENIENKKKDVEKESGKSSLIFSHEEPAGSDNKHTTAAIQFSKHIKHLRLHEPFHFIQKNPSNNNKNHDKSHHSKSETEKDSIEQPSATNVIQK